MHPHRQHLHTASSPSVRNKLSQLLQHAARGVHANPTARPIPLAVWVHGCLDSGLKREEAARERAKAAVGGATGEVGDKRANAKVAAVGSVIQGTVAGVGKAKRAGLSVEDAAALHEWLLVDFALQVGVCVCVS